MSRAPSSSGTTVGEALNILTAVQARPDVGYLGAIGRERALHFYLEASRYAYADRNQRIEIRSPRYTHDALVLGNFRRFVAINSALDIDLTGQVNAETVAGHSVGLTGGQMDFVRAANRAPEGRSIIALPSTSRDRKHSRIVARLADGIVTTPRAEADCVVTEHGIAELRGRTLAERARALTLIADPAFRAELERAGGRLV